MYNRAVMGNYAYILNRESMKKQKRQSLARDFVMQGEYRESFNLFKAQPEFANLLEEDVIERFIDTDEQRRIRFERYYSDYAGVTAALNKERVAKISGSASVIQAARDHLIKVTEPYKELKTSDVDSRISELLHDISEIGRKVRAGTKKIQTGSELISNAEDITEHLNYKMTGVKTVGGFGAMQRAYENLYLGKQTVQAAFFDIETLGGRNILGLQDIDYITEYAFNFKGTKIAGMGEIGSIIGISDKQAGIYENILQDIGSRGIRSERERIVAERLYKYGTMEYDEVARGIFRPIKMLQEADFSDIKSMRRGLDVLKRIHGQQSKELIELSSGRKVMGHEKQFLDLLDSINTNKEMLLVGHNIVEFDIPVLNRMLAKRDFWSGAMWEELQLRQGTPGALPSLPSLTGRTMDMRTVSQIAMSLFGRDRYYKTQEQRNIQKKFTPGTLEALARLAGHDYSANMAHTAMFDVRATRTVFENLIPGMMEDISTKLGKSSALNLQNKILMANETHNYFQGGKHFLAFTEDAFTGELKTFSGLNLGSVKGTALEKQIFGEVGVRRNLPYSVSTRQIDLAEDAVEILRKTDPGMAQGRLFSARLTPAVAPRALDAKSSYAIQSPVTYLFRSQEELEGFLETFYDVADTDIWEKDLSLMRLEPDPITRKLVPRREVIAPEKRLEVLQQLGEHRIVNDTTRRFVAENRLDKIEKLQGLYDEVATHLGSQASHKEVRDAIMEGIAKTTSSEVAAGHVFTIKNQEGKVKNIELATHLGFGRDKKLYSQTVSRMIPAIDYLNSQRELLERIKHEKLGGVTTGSRAQFQFDYIINDLRAGALSLLGDNPELRRGLLKNIYEDMPEALSFYAKDMDFFQFDVSGFTRRRPELVQQAEDIGENLLRVDLRSGKEYDFINKLIRLQGYEGQISDSQKIQRGWHAAKQFVEHINETGLYPDIFKGLDPADYRDMPYTLGEAMLSRIRSYKEKNMETAFLREAVSQNVRVEDRMFSFLRGSGYLDELLKNITPPSYLTFGRGEEHRIHDIVRDMLVPDKEGVMQRVRGMFGDSGGFKGDPSKILATDLYYDVLLKEETEVAEKIIGGFLRSHEKARVFYDPTKNMLLAHQPGMGTVDLLERIPRITFEGPGMVINLGRNRYNLGMGFDFNKQTQPVMRSAIGRALDGTYINWYSAAQKKEGVVHLNRVLSRLAEGVREGTPAITRFGIDEQLKNYQVRFFQDITKHIDKFRDTFEFMSEHDERIISGLFRKMDRGRTIASPRDLTSAERETLYKYRGQMQRHMAGFAVDPRVKDVILSLTSDLQETQVAEGWLGIGTFSPDPLTQLASQKRPTKQQRAKQHLYTVAEMEERIRKLGLTDALKIGETAISPAHAAYRTDSLGRALTGTTRMEIAQISESRLRKLLNKETLFKEIKTYKDITGVSIDEKKALSMISGLGTTKDERIMRARVADAVAHRNNYQIINQRRQIAIDLVNNFDAIEYVNELRYQVLPEITIDATGKVNIQLRDGKRVSRGHQLVDLVSNFGGTVQQVGVKAQHGRIRYMAFDPVGGAPLGSAELTEQVNKLIGSGFFTGTKTETEKLSRVYDLIEQNFRAGIALEDITAPEYFKTMVGAEKGMTRSLVVGLGVLDPKIKGYLKRRGLGKFIGQKVSLDEVERIIQDKDYLEYALAERYAIDDIAGSVLERHGISAQVLTDMDISKHGEHFMRLEGMMGLLMRHYEGQEEQLLSDLEQAGVKFGIPLGVKDGQLMTDAVFEPGTEVITRENMLKMRAFMESKGIDPYIRNAQGEIIGSKGVMGVTHAYEQIRATASSGRPGDAYLRDIEKGLKFGPRELDMMRIHRYSDRFVRELVEDEHMGHLISHAVTKDDAGQFVLREKYLDRPFMQGFIEELQKDMRYGFGEALPGSGLKNISDVSRFRLKDVLDADPDTYGHLKGFLGAEGFSNISVKKAEDYYSFIKGISALRYNEGQIGTEELLSKGFNKISIGDIQASIGGDADELAIRGRGSIYADDMLVDLGAEFGPKRYIAAGRLPFRRHGEEVVAFDAQKELSVIKRLWEDMQLARQGKLQDANRDIETIKTQIFKRREEFLGKYAGHIAGAEGIAGDMRSIRVTRSLMGKSSSALLLEGLDKEGALQYHGFKNRFFEGFSLEEHARRGRYIDAAFVSKKAALNMGMTPEEIEMAMKEGVSGIGMRFPTIKEGSPIPMRVYIGDLPDNMIKMTTWSQSLMQADNDADNLFLMLRKFNSNLGAKQDETAYMLYRATQINPIIAAKDKEAMHKHLLEAADMYRDADLRGIVSSFADTDLSDAMLQGLSGDRLDKYKEAQDALVAKAAKGSIGEVNFRLYQARQMSIALGTSAEQELVQQFSDALEQAALIPKSGGRYQDTHMLQEFSDSMNALMFGQRGAGRGQLVAFATSREDAVKKLSEQALVMRDSLETLRGTRYQGLLEDISTLSGDPGSEVFQKRVVAGMAGAVEEIISGADPETARRIRSSMMLGVQKEGLDIKYLNTPIAGSEMEWISKVADATGLDPSLTSSHVGNVRSYRAPAATAGLAAGTGRLFTETTTESTGHFLSDFLTRITESSLTSRSMAFGAMGIAGAVLLAGFVGGDPRRAAESQAMEDSGGQYYGPPLQDSGIGISQNNRGGYIINISAEAAQDKRQLGQVMNQVIQEGFNSRVNLAINIKDQHGNINDREVEAILSRMLS